MICGVFEIAIGLGLSAKLWQASKASRGSRQNDALSSFADCFGFFEPDAETLNLG